MSSNRFPNLTAENLSREKKELPRDFAGKLNVVLIAFRQDHIGLLASWEPFLEEMEEEHEGVRFYELPTLSSSYAPIRWWIDGGMRGGIRDERARERTITLYTNKGDFKRALGIRSEETIHLLLLSDGAVIWRGEGEYTQEKFDELKGEVGRRLAEGKG